MKTKLEIKTRVLKGQLVFESGAMWDNNITHYQLWINDKFYREYKLTDDLITYVNKNYASDEDKQMAKEIKRLSKLIKKLDTKLEKVMNKKCGLLVKVKGSDKLFRSLV